MLLAIDSSIKGYSLALVNATELVFSFSQASSRSQFLINELKAAFSEHNIGLEALTYIAVNIGPGSFTGIRTALTVVKTLQAQLKLKVIPVNNFQLLRYLHPEQKQLAFRASAKNMNEYFVSLSEDYTDIENNFFSTDLDDVTLVDLPESLAEILIKYLHGQKDIEKLVVNEIKPYYLREPSLRKAKALS